ncbi:hypothetical protein ACFLVZ_01550 [Chloroflexota bacterium]
MPGYLLKGLLTTLLIILVFIGVGAGVGFYIYNNLVDEVDSAQERGFEEGYTQGYEEGLSMGNEAGYQEGSKAALMEANGINTSLIDPGTYYFLYNPTYDEIQMALTAGEMSSAREILDYAKDNGIRAAYVRVPIAREARAGRVYLYQLVAFETVDKGFIIIEPRSHREVIVEVGRSYSDLNNFPASPYDDTITKVTIVW